MTRIRIMHARIPDALPKAGDIAQRLETFLRRLRGGSASQREWEDFGTPTGPTFVSEAERARIKARAEAYVIAFRRSTGAAHLDARDIDAIRALKDGATLVALRDEAKADEIGAALEAEMPWMNPVNDRIWRSLRRSVRLGEPGIRLPPVLLVGPPGIGKSHWASRLGELLRLPTTVIEATGEPASFAVVGSQRGWGSAGPGRLMQTLLTTLVANPILVVDEIEKAGDVHARGGQSYSLGHALLPLMERSTAARWTCPYYRVAFDVSWVGWVLTANGTRGIPAPLLSRCPPLHLLDLTVAHLAAFARRQVVARGLPDEVAEVIAEAVSRADGRPASLRTVMRMIEAAEAIAERPVLHGSIEPRRLPYQTF